MNRMARIILDPNRTYAGTRTAVQLCGSQDESFQRKLRELCSEYSDIFSDQLAEKPASLKPFEFNIPLEIWEKDENRTPVRPQSSTKEVALKEDLDEMLASRVIERSDAAYYSHPVIVT